MVQAFEGERFRPLFTIGVSLSVPRFQRTVSGAGFSVGVEDTGVCIRVFVVIPR